MTKPVRVRFAPSPTGYRFICGGYDHGGLYGRTWALFVKDN